LKSYEKCKYFFKKHLNLATITPLATKSGEKRGKLGAARFFKKGKNGRKTEVKKGIFYKITTPTWSKSLKTLEMVTSVCDIKIKVVYTEK
jgi:hypothetical protein